MMPSVTMPDVATGVQTVVVRATQIAFSITRAV